MIKSHSDDYDSRSIDSLTLDSRANGKFPDFEHLRKITLKNVNLVTIAQININLLRNKFSLLCEAVSGNIDILLVTETKLVVPSLVRSFICMGTLPLITLTETQMVEGFYSM